MRCYGSDWHGTVQHLHVGENTIVVSASLTGHQSAEDTITVTRHHTQAEVEAIAQANKEREAREKAKQEQAERVEREHKEVEERAERKHKEVENATLSQQNALKSAEQYLETSAFSEAGLIEQLSSEAGSKYPHADAVWAVEHLEVNWDEQAVKAAKQYLSTSSFSCQGLIEQLDSEAGSKFTVAQRGREIEISAVLATHSIDVLLGALTAEDASVTVLRLRRDGAVNRAAVLEPEAVHKIWNDPIILYSNALDGIFHRDLIVCEGDADARFYDATLQAVRQQQGSGDMDCSSYIAAASSDPQL